MRAVLQRAGRARVEVESRIVGKIERGYVVLLGIEADDAEQDAKYIAEKIINLRVFDDEQGKLNLSILDSGGQVLLVSQFTLYGDARSGRRPSFIRAAKSEVAVPLFESVKHMLEEAGLRVETGVFGALMNVELVNDGPVTILLDSKKIF